MEENTRLRQQVLFPSFLSLYASTHTHTHTHTHTQTDYFLLILLVDQVVDMSQVGKQVVTGLENGFHEEGQSSESVTNASNSDAPQDYNDSSDTSLKLG